MDSKRRDRVAKACAQCRRKKIKCDGENPCSHCQNLNLKCVYESNKTRKPRKSPTEAFSNRLRRLEDLVLTLVTKIDSLNGFNPNQGSKNGSDQANTKDLIKDDLDLKSDNSASESLSDESDGSDLPRQDETPQAMFKQFKQLCNDPLQKPGDPTSVSNQYRGSHLGFHLIFSELTLNHVRLVLREECHDIIMPLETMPLYILGWKKLLQNIWSEPRPISAESIQKLRIGSFPEQGLVNELLQLYLYINFCWSICTPQQAHEMFRRYYDIKTSRRAKGKLLSYSELMVMSLLLAVTISAFVEGLKIPSSNHEMPILNSMDVPKIVAIQEEMFSNALYYYHRICLISEGVASVQALLLLVLYLEMTWVHTDVNSVLCSLAVLYAQEIGLHRLETYHNLSEEEKTLRMLVWISCQFFDTEMCYRLGKPMLTNVFDRHDIIDYPVTCTSYCGQAELGDTFNRFIDLRSYSYLNLFSAHVDYSSVKRIQETVMSINLKLEALLDRMDPFWRPKFFYDSNFESALTAILNWKDEVLTTEFILTFQLMYFSQLMIINRVPWNIPNLEGESPPQENSKFRSISLDSARTILHIIRASDQKKSPFFCLNWFATYPFLASMNLLSNAVNHPQDPETIKDIDLLIDVSINFFALVGDKVEVEATRLYYLRFHMIDMVIRVVLLIAIAIVEQTSNINILGQNPMLKGHFDYVKKRYPHYYRRIPESESLQKYMKQFYYNSGFFHNPRKGLSQKANEGLKGSNSPYDSNTPHSSDYSGSGSNFMMMPDQAEETDGMDMKGFQMWDSIGIDFNDPSLQQYQNLPNMFFDNGI